jgi:hypothetical protein
MKILVATDGSKPALNAVKYASKLLQSLSSSSNSITLVSVHDDAGLRHAKAFVGKEVVADYLTELSEKELKPARKSLDSTGVQHDIDVEARKRVLQRHRVLNLMTHADPWRRPDNGSRSSCHGPITLR